MSKVIIDINCDVGEGVVTEEVLFPYISSCSIACGGHFGTENTIKDTINLAIQHGVDIGVHPSYPDKDNFGRVSIQMSEESFVNTIKEQINFFVAILSQKKINLHHIKPHGALYNDLAKNHKLAVLFLKCIEAFKEKTLLYAPYGSIIAKEAKKQGFKVFYEAFADRNYEEDLSLVSRKSNKALIENPKKVLEHIKIMVKQEKVRTVSGVLVPIKANTFCVHGDTVSALDILAYLSVELPKLNI